jgi:hypothetical protein
MQSIVYILGLLTSATCAFLLARSYAQNPTRLILFTAICFALLAVNNLLVVIDLLILPDIGLLPLRQLAALAAISVLLFGFIWDTE